MNKLEPHLLKYLIYFGLNINSQVCIHNHLVVYFTIYIFIYKTAVNSSDYR